MMLSRGHPGSLERKKNMEVSEKRDMDVTSFYLSA